MNITVIEAPRTTGLTTVLRMRTELGILDSVQDSRLDTLIEEVSADIVAYCQQPLIRQTVTERQVGYGRTVQMLGLTPVPHAGITEVRFRGNPVSGYSVYNPEAGMIYTSHGRWESSRVVEQWIERSQPNMPGEQAYEFDYSGGYTLPGDNFTVTDGTTQANDVENSFEILGGVTTFPILVSGESIIVQGYLNSANNGRFMVLSRTATKLFVHGTLVPESGNSVTYLCNNLPRDLEGACVRETRARWFARNPKIDPNVKSESLGDWSATYGGTMDNEASNGGLSAAVARTLDKYVRMDNY